MTKPVIGALPGDYFCKDGIKRFLAELAPVAAKLKKAGMDFSYHNHNHELILLSGIFLFSWKDFSILSFP